MNKEYFRDKFERSLDLDILSEAVIKNPDRDILSVILECYSNLGDTMLAAYSIGVADQKAQFRMTYKEHLQKIDIPDDRIASDINYLENAFYELKLRYIMRPDLLADKYKIAVVKNTLENYDLNPLDPDPSKRPIVSQYQYINSTIYQILQDRLKRYEELAHIPDAPEKKKKKDKEEKSKSVNEFEANLFVAEQSIIIPMLHKTHKYKIDGYNYYGVYNDARSTQITADNKFSCVVTRNGKSSTYYMKINEHKIDKKHTEERLDLIHFGNEVNPFFLLTSGRVADEPLRNIIEPTGNEAFDKMIENTYNAAVEMEARGETPPRNVVPRLRPKEVGFRQEFIQCIYEYAQKLDEDLFPTNVERKRLFMHLAKLENDIYNSINNERRKIKATKLEPTRLIKRKNLSPMNVYTTIKQGYNNSRADHQSQMFESSTTAPNPIDLFKLFQFIKISHHTATKLKPKGKTSKNQLGVDTQLVRYNDMRYVGTFAPKNATNMNASVVLHFDIGEENLSMRNERFRDIFVTDIREIRRNKK